MHCRTRAQLIDIAPLITAGNPVLPTLVDTVRETTPKAIQSTLDTGSQLPPALCKSSFALLLTLFQRRSVSYFHFLYHTRT